MYRKGYPDSSWNFSNIFIPIFQTILQKHYGVNIGPITHRKTMMTWTEVKSRAAVPRALLFARSMVIRPPSGLPSPIFPDIPGLMGYATCNDHSYNCTFDKRIPYGFGFHYKRIQFVTLPWNHNMKCHWWFKHHFALENNFKSEKWGMTEIFAAFAG